MSDKKLCAKEQLVPQAMRRAIVDNRAMMARLLNLDAAMDSDEFYAELLRLCLFEKQERENPNAVFQSRLNNGDYLPVQPNEDPDNLRPGRDPKTEDELDAVAAQAIADKMFWNGSRYAPAIDIVRSIMLTS